MEKFLITLIIAFFVAIGVVVGGSIIGGIGAFLINEPPMKTIAQLANNLKIWALVAAIGGTFDMITNLERGLFYGTPTEIVKQILLVMFAMSGAYTGTQIIQWFTQETIH
ncbi:sporulation protein [Pueribacillus theae]|uniref:Sporulation protein n=1 Tax=Pueribacillus theae TaxID=2171751 RepID=A0A2U1K141_9BACI|nr:YtrH family sporulation protein [Pueribacillus theae]PWA11122.1 sporulation protein [Pueribacillus theae]